MKTKSRAGAAAARGIALFTAVPLILSAVAAPGLGNTAAPVDDVGDLVEEKILPETDAESELLVETPVESIESEGHVEPEAPIAEKESPTSRTLEAEALVEGLSQATDQHCGGHQAHPGKVEAKGEPASAEKTVTVDGVDVRVVVDGATVSFYDAAGDPIVMTFCVKASTENSGQQTGSSYTVDFVNPGGNNPDISYVVVYSVIQAPPPPPPEAPTLKVTKWVTGQDAPARFTTFKFAVDCGDGPSWFLLRHGQSWTETYDAGTECTVTEVWTRGADVSHRLGKGEWVDGTSATVTIESGHRTWLTFRNDYEPAPETITIELAKQWFDVDGDLTDEPEVDWGLELYTTGPNGGDEVVASLPGENTVATFAFDDEGHPARYGVVESPTPAGWKAVPCGDHLPYEGENVVNTDTSAIQSTRAPDGSYAATTSGVHLVCNQKLPPVPPTIRPPRPVDPETVDLGLVKVWLDVDGEILTRPSDAAFAVTLSVEGEVLATVDRDSPTDGVWVEMEVGTDYVIAEPTLPPGWEAVACPAGVIGDGDVAHGFGTFTLEEAGRHLVCNQAEVEVAPIIIEEPEPRPERTPKPEPDPKVEPAPVAKPIEVEEPEVLGEVIEAELPRTGLDAILLMLLALLLSAIGVSTVVATKRPTRPR